jgi:hypothetical protein
LGGCISPATAAAHLLHPTLGVFEMSKLNRIPLAAASAAFLLAHGSPAEAGHCFTKAASGTNTSLEGAKSQVYEALLQSFDWGTWASWMASGSTPGYKVGAPRYSCAKGGLGYTCKGVSTICTTS